MAVTLVTRGTTVKKVRINCIRSPINHSLTPFSSYHLSRTFHTSILHAYMYMYISVFIFVLANVHPRCINVQIIVNL